MNGTGRYDLTAGKKHKTIASISSKTEQGDHPEPHSIFRICRLSPIAWDGADSRPV